MKLSSQQSERQLARDILEYFLRNPLSADSLEGVAYWRLLDQTIHRTLAETKAALEWLVSKGFLQEISGPGSDHTYELNPQKRVAAEQFIDQGNRPEPPKP